MRFFTIFFSFLLILTTWGVSRAQDTTMALIPAGEYQMGNHSTNPIHDKLNEFALPVHTVSIDAFWMDIYELTNQKYCEYLNSAYGQGLIEVSDNVVYKAGDTEPYCDTYESSPNSRIHWDGNDFAVTQGKEDHPMVEVSWYGAVAFANWKSAEEGLSACYNLETWECDFDAEGFRLPTEAEWEKASRGGHHNPYYMYSWGSNTTNNNEGNFLGSGDPYEDDIPSTTPVGYYAMANGYGLYDMAGNVWEWCNDWWDYDYPSESPYDNPRGPEKGVIKVNKGGGYYSRPIVNSRNATRCNACHGFNTPASGNILGFNVGFRLASRKALSDVETEHGRLPKSFQLFQSYPNPFNPNSTIRYDLPQASDVSLILCDILGREVARLVDGYVEPGYHEVQWNGRELASSIYIARLVTPEYSKSIKMVLLK